MSAILPFRALRPAPEHAAAVSSVPYDVVSTEEARQLVAGNPLSFLRVTRSEVDLPVGSDPYAAAVYARARENLATLRGAARLVQDEEPSLYFYRLRSDGHEQVGIAGGFSLDDYDRDIVKKHERTRRDKEDDRTRHIVELRAQTGVVFLTYRASAAVDAVAARVTAGAPLYDFTAAGGDFSAADGVQHTLWRVDGDDAALLVSAFERVPSLYIADGHHRAASAARARGEVPDSRAAESFVAVAFPDNQVRILPYNRVVKDLAGLTPEGLLAALRERCPVLDGSPRPSGKGEVSMYLAGAWYAIDVSRLAPEDDSVASGLDVALLQRHVLEALLKIADIRIDKRIDFIGGARGTAALEHAVDSGAAAVAFSLHPVTLDDLMRISDAGGIMPPKSTWFEPKLRDGLLIHTI